MKQQLYIGIFIISGALASGSTLSGQHLQSWSSFYENGFIYNPALTARWSSLEVSFGHRQTWSGFDNAPEYSFVGVQYPFLRAQTRVSMGAHIEQDKVGPFTSQSIAGTYTYKIRPRFLGKSDDVLSFGVKVGAAMYNFDPTSATTFDGLEIDPLIPALTTSSIHPTLDIGFFYNSISNRQRRSIDDKGHYFFGLSVRDLMSRNKIVNLAGVIQSSPHLSVHGGYRTRALGQDRNRYFEHNYLVDYTFTRAWLLMYNLRFELKDKYWLSGGGVTNGEVFAQAGLIISGYDYLTPILSRSGTLRIGGKVNYNVFALRNFAGVGFELFVAYQFEL